MGSIEFLCPGEPLIVEYCERTFGDTFRKKLDGSTMALGYALEGFQRVLAKEARRQEWFAYTVDEEGKRHLVMGFDGKPELLVPEVRITERGTHIVTHAASGEQDYCGGPGACRPCDGPPTIDEATLIEWLKPLSHRPGWEIKPAGRVLGGLYIVITASGQDSNNPNDPTKRFTAGPVFAVPSTIKDAGQLYDWILDECIPGIETHERWEWFRVNGKKWRDPHAVNMPAFATDF